MQSLLEDYDISDLHRHYQSGTLHTFLGVNHRRAEVIGIYLREQKHKKSEMMRPVESNDIVTKCDSSMSSPLVQSYETWLHKLHNCPTTVRQLFRQHWRTTTDFESSTTTNMTNTALTPDAIEHNPMLMLALTDGISWKTIDKLALANAWWAKDSEQRIDVFVEYIVLDVCKKEGHTYLTLPRFLSEWNTYQNKYPELPDDFIPYLQRLVNRHKTTVLTEANTCQILQIVPESLFQQEKSIVSGIAQMLSVPSKTHYTYSRHDFTCSTLSDEQLQAINGILNGSLVVLTGKGGTGKTSCVLKNVIMKIQEHKDSYLLLSPTHAAKKNAFIEIDKGRVDYKHHYHTIQSYTYPIGEDTCKLEMHIQNMRKGKSVHILHVFVEECSMVDREQFAKLISICARDKRIRLTLLGDVNQLPAIGAGQIFSDVVHCSAIPTFTLTKQYRSQHSDIAEFCEMILGNGDQKQSWNIGTMSNPPFRDVSYHFSGGLLPDAIESVLTSYRDQGLLPAGVRPHLGGVCGTLQVITNRNVMCGTLVPIVRRVFGKALCHSTDANVSTSPYATSDPVLLRTNTTVFKNGDAATITHIANVDKYTTRYTLQLVDCEAPKNVSKADAAFFHYRMKDNVEFITVDDKHIKPMLARTVHSTQGLGFDVVLYVLGHDFPIDTNMHYTAYSRAKKHLHLFGSRDYFGGTRARTPVRKKNSFIAKWLENMKL